MRSSLPLPVVATVAVAAALSLTGCSLLRESGNRNVQQPAKPVELDRYLGRWYELARYEAPFQRGCEAVTATYSLRRDGRIRVLNACRKGSVSARETSREARAYVVDGSNGAKLKVSFFGTFYADYWVMDRADDYTWALVGEPSGKYLWLLSRTPQPGEAAYQSLVARAAALGYDTARLRRTQHPAN